MNKENKITKTAFYEQAPAEVWKAITSHQALSTWFMKTDLRPEVGAKYIMTYKNGSVSGEIKEADEPTKLSYTWIVSGTTAETLVEWFLKKKDSGTEVTLVHSGFDKYEDTEREAQFKSHESGWGHQLGKALPGYLAKK